MHMLLILQNVISASQHRAKIEELVIIPATDTGAAADIVLLGSTAIEVIIATVFIV